MKKNLLFLLLSVILSALCAVLVSRYYVSQHKYVHIEGERPAYKNVEFVERDFPDFTYAAENTVEGVVQVRVLKRTEAPREATILEHFFGYGVPHTLPRESVNSGSGVIISADGYIVTNNHVVEGASECVVAMNNNKSYQAKIVGTDPVTDIALLKIEAENLPVVPMGSSDKLRLGEWVLAIGSPFNLKSTITAGIVSAKGRSLPDMSGDFKIESFIQTDAAVNPGNSGGALVNVKGELVGINTAIASNTGSYAGYSFAVPTAIVQKVVSDIKEYGSVQRAMLGISMQELTDELAKKAGVEGDFSGVYVAAVELGGAADLAGVSMGDILLAIDSVVVKSPSDVQEKINGYRPNDTIAVTVLRNGDVKKFQVLLQGRGSGISQANAGNGKMEIFGAVMENASPELMKRLRIKGGVQIKTLKRGKFKDAGVKEGLIITHINQTPVADIADVHSLISKARRSVLVEGVYPNGSVYYYGIGV